MKLFLVLCIFTLAVAFSLAEPDSEFQDTFEEEDAYESRQKEHNKCQTPKDVDLSEFNLKMSDVRKLGEISAKQGDGEQLPYQDGGSADAIKTRLNENGMGVIRKKIVSSAGNTTYAKVMKTGKSNGDFSTFVSGSLKSSREASTSGKAKFEIDLQIFSARGNPNKVVTGDADIAAKSATAWIKEGDRDVLQTQASATTAVKIQWTDTSAPEKSGSATLDSAATSTAGTIVLSKKCFSTKVGLAFNAKAAGSDWSSTISGEGRGQVLTRILFATQNGTSVSWTTATLRLLTNLEIEGKKGTITGTQNITIKAFTETITRPGKSQNDERVIEVSSEIKLRVGVKTTLSTGTVVYASGGQVVFRSLNVKIPPGTEINGESNDSGAQIAAGNVLQKQVQSDDLLVNPDFVNNVASTPMN